MELVDRDAFVESTLEIRQICSMFILIMKQNDES